MGAAASRAGVSEFLKRFKARAAAGGLTFVPRGQNLDAITTLGLTIGAVEQIVLGLTEADSLGGPEHDRGGSPGEVWSFTVFDGGRGINIELKICDSFAACRSFRPTGRPSQPSRK
jgi:hypothetical protein